MRSVNFTGIGLDVVVYDDLYNAVDRWISNKNERSHHIACVNAYCIALALANTRLAKIYNGADIAGPDGMPFVKWIRYFYNLPCDRFAAPDIILQLAQKAKEKNYSFYLYGGSPDMVVNMKDFLKTKYPYINIVGYYSPPFRTLTQEEDNTVVDEINKLRPDIICVGLGTPKQDYWIDEHLDIIKGSVMIASGATFDFFGGRIKMAPSFIRKSGFEWLYRLLGKDFFRLWKRYTYYNFIFLWNFFLQILKIHTIQPQKWSRR